MWLWLAACRGGSVFTVVDSGEGSTFDAIAVTAVDGAPALAPRLVVDLAFDGTLMVTWFDGVAVRKVATEAVGDHHEVQLLGLRPATDYTFEISAFGERTAAQTRVELRTDDLPADLPAVSTPTPAADAATDTLVVLGAADDTADGRLVVLRGDGSVAWWADLGEPVEDALADAAGLTVLVGGAAPRVVRMGWDLAQQGTWSVGGLGTQLPTSTSGPLHDSLTAVGDGWLVLQRVATEGVDLPLDYAGATTGTRTFADERGIAFDPDGEVTRELAASLFWPVARLGWGSLDDGPDGADLWADARHLEVGADGTWLWTLRHQDAVVAVDPATGAVAWALVQPYALPGDLAARALAATDLPWHPTWASFGPGADRVLVFDSGAAGAAPPDPMVAPTASRALVYAVDPAAGTARVTAEVVPPGGPLVSARGQVRPRDAGLLAVWGAVGSPARAELVGWDDASGVVLHHVLRAEAGVTVRTAFPVPVLDAASSITTSDLQTTTTTADSGGHSG